MSTQHTNFIKGRLHQAIRRAWSAPAASISAVMLTGALISSPVMAQQAGSIKGKVATEAASVSISGVTVTASSDEMPKPRTVQTKEDGSYVLPALKPGTYTLTFTSADGSVRQMTVDVLLDQTASVDVAFDAAPIDSTEIIQIIGARISREGDSSLSNSLGKDVMDRVPSGQDYRELLAIIPGVQYSEYNVLGPSAGGSGRDNSFTFDGADVSMPMYGNLSGSPSTHDVAYVSIDRGGAKAIGFNRAGGISVNTLSKSGTNDFHASIEYRIEPKSLTSDKDELAGSEATSKRDRSWITTSVSGALIEDELFFYGSFYSPDTTQSSNETAYGATKDKETNRDEYFGKLTWAPTEDLLLNLSYRNVDKNTVGDSVGAKSTDSSSAGSTEDTELFIFDGSYLINDDTVLSFQYSSFQFDLSGRPDNLLPNVIPTVGESIDLTKLEQLGAFLVPELQATVGYDNIAAQTLIDTYGYMSNGVRTGGGGVGVDASISDQNYQRQSFEVKLDHEFEFGNTFHNLHVGFQWKDSSEELVRYSNGWGNLSYKGGTTVDNLEGGTPTPIYYQASVYTNSLVTGSNMEVTPLISSSVNYNFEVNDTIEHGDFTYNIGFMLSNDILYGQGLKNNSTTVSGYEAAPGHKYKMYELDFLDMIQPRLGVTWAYNGDDTVFANFASYNPDTTSLARAASWDRNNQSTQTVYFDKNGDYITHAAGGASSGKLFQDNLKARRTDEITIGMTKYLSNELFLRTHVRQRTALHAWEDVPNDARLYGEYGPFGGVPKDIADKGLYIENLAAYREQLGGGSSYVIAELDGSENTYYEWSIEGDYTADNIYLNVSYVWSNYFGNYDQDITSADSDGNLFVGSSNLGDGKGRMLWDGKYGKLHGNKPHVLKALGYYTTDWNANIGFNFVFQSGDVWEAWDGGKYGYSNSTIRYAEPAGSRRESSHWQLDLNYAQSFDLSDDLVLKFRADVYNIFDRQTGYSYEPVVSSSTFGEARNLINPRRVQLSVNVSF
ncbi:carboxypeptidase regulatory-like domain-containing protein [Paraglaciecola sp.]|uniref:carboxypeptidase regulatory-like domain-containing protein n=1 Tax=Paraglaciecola sp. TaxID=1920173 RepID=UPI0030F4814E